MEEKTQQEKDVEELQMRRLQDLVANQQQFNLEVLSRFQKLERLIGKAGQNPEDLIEEIEKVKKGINLILEALENSRESNKIAQEDEVKTSKVISVQKEVEKEEDSEEDEDFDEDDELGYKESIMTKDKKRI